MVKTKHALVTALFAASLIPDISVAQNRFEIGRSNRAPHFVTSMTPDSAPGEKIVDLPLTGGGRQRVLYASPVRPTATIVMLPGGAGDLGLRRDGDVLHDDNFVVPVPFGCGGAMLS
jgi:hypothetical protein